MNTGNLGPRRCNAWRVRFAMRSLRGRQVWALSEREQMRWGFRMADAIAAKPAKPAKPTRKGKRK